MKQSKRRIMAVVLTLAMILVIGGLPTVQAVAATKSVSVSYTNKKVKKATVKSVALSIDGNKASKKATIYLSGTKKVNVDTVATVNINGKSSNKKPKNYSKVSYKSTDTSVATVNTKGVITAKKIGSTYITVTSKADKKKLYKVKVTVKSGVKSMKLNSKTSLSMTAGDSTSFTPKVTTYKKIKTNVKATTSNKKIATVSVSSKGKVTIKAVAEGTAKITVYPAYGSDKAKVITVKVKAKEIVVPPKAYDATQVVFTDVNMKAATLTGTISYTNSSVKDVVKNLAADMGGTYTVTVNGKQLSVVNGTISQAELDKIPTSSSKTDATISSTLAIKDALALVANVNGSYTFAGSLSISGGVGSVSDISFASGKLTCKFNSVTYKMFVSNGNLYIEGDVVTLGNLAIVTSNSTVIKEFKGVYLN